MMTSMDDSARRANLVDRLRSTAHGALERLRFERDARLAPRATRLVLVSDREAYCSEQQLAPFHAQRGLLRKRLNLVFHDRALPDVLRDPAAAFTGADAIGLKLSFRKTAEEARRIVTEVARHKGNAKLIYFDGDDDSAIEWPSVLPFVDLWVKKHVFADPATYRRRFVGRNNLTDYVAKAYGYDFADDPIPESTPVDPRHLDRLHLAYNIALDDKIVTLYQRTQNCWLNPTRPNDIVCRASLDHWLAPLRSSIEPAVASLKGRYRIILPTVRVPQDEYDRELSESKICISPFGYGEICWRDFEAVLWGCLMIKPRMDAIRTRPDIFVPYETYVPVEWDLSDLSRKCAYYLEHPDERRRIVARAYTVLSSYYEHEKFLDEVTWILRRARVGDRREESLASASRNAA